MDRMQRFKWVSATAALFWGALVCAPAQFATGTDTNEIPPLRPPITSLPQGFWEKHGTVIVAAAAALVILGIIIAFLMSRRKPPAPPRPAEVAQKALVGLREKPAPLSGEDLGRIARITKVCLLQLTGLRQEELTTAEFCMALRGQTLLDPEQQQAICRFLNRCDTARFAPGGSVTGWNPIDEALTIINAAAQRGMAQAAAEPEVASK